MKKRIRIGVLCLAVLLVGIAAVAYSDGWFTEVRNVYFKGLARFQQDSTFDQVPQANAKFYSGYVPVVLYHDTTTHKAVGTTEQNGTSVNIPSGMLSAGKGLRVTGGGTSVGTNGGKIVKLNMAGTTVLTLTTAGSTAGDWEATFLVSEDTDSAHQKVVGKLVQTGVVPVSDYATATVDMSGGGYVRLIVDNANASDNCTQETGLVEFLP